MATDKVIIAADVTTVIRPEIRRLIQFVSFDDCHKILIEPQHQSKWLLGAHQRSHEDIARGSSCEDSRRCCCSVVNFFLPHLRLERLLLILILLVIEMSDMPVVLVFRVLYHVLLVRARCCGVGPVLVSCFANRCWCSPKAAAAPHFSAQGEPNV